MTQERGEFQENSQSVSVLINREAKKIIVEYSNCWRNRCIERKIADTLRTKIKEVEEWHCRE
jgi:hypothetical protein